MFLHFRSFSSVRYWKELARIHRLAGTRSWIKDGFCHPRDHWQGEWWDCHGVHDSNVATMATIRRSNQAFPCNCSGKLRRVRNCKNSLSITTQTTTNSLSSDQCKHCSANGFSVSSLWFCLNTLLPHYVRYYNINQLVTNDYRSKWEWIWNMYILCKYACIT